MTEIQHLTQAQLHEKIADILRKYPELEAYDAEGFCCSACAFGTVARDLSREAAFAWEDLQNYLFLLS